MNTVAQQRSVSSPNTSIPTASKEDLVSVIIPTFNGLDLLKKHLPFVLKMMRNGDELVIVDDASTDESVTWLRAEFKLQKQTQDQEKVLYAADNFQVAAHKHISIRVIANTTNLRFAASCNRGVTLSRGTRVFLLNNDVAPYADVLEFLLPHFEEKEVFAVGCLEHEQAEKEVLGGKNTLWFERGIFIHSRAENYTSGETSWVSGGSGMFDKNKWSELEGFDLQYYPAYWEDVDISYRASQKGWKVLFEERAQVDHNHESTNKDVFGLLKIIEMGWKNGDYFTWKNGTVWQKIQYLVWRPYWWRARAKLKQALLRGERI